MGENSRPDDTPCKPTKKKHVTNHRSSTKDNVLRLRVPRKLTLDSALKWARDDGPVEVTPNHIRVRKAILDPEACKRQRKRLLVPAG